MNWFDFILYIIGAVLTGGILTYPIAFLHGQISQNIKQQNIKQFESDRLKSAKAGIQRRRNSKISF